MAKYEYKYRETFYHDGQRYDVKAKTAKELVEKISKKKMQLKAGVINNGMTVAEWSNIWLEKNKKNSVGIAWYKTIKGILNNHILPIVGHVPVKDVLPIHIQDVLLHCKHLANSHITKIYNILREMFEAAKVNRLIKINPVEGVSKPKGKKNQKRRAVTDYERRHILAVCEQYPKTKLFIYLMLYAGLRPQEVARLQWRHIDFKKRSIIVESALKRDGSTGEPKSDSGLRKIPIRGILYDVLIANRKGSFEYVCTQTCGKPHTRSSLQQMWNSFERRLNISMGCKTYKGKVLPPYRVAEDLVLYCLRHTYCTDLQAMGIPINLAREYMGHSDIRTTSGIYTHESQIAFDTMLSIMDEADKKQNVENVVENNLENIEK